jgi:streptomycin 3"-adenylyltransferase
MSIVIEKFIGKDFRYPTPYEFHMGTKEQIQFHGLPHTEEMTDPDLAAHLMIIKKRGVCVYGKSIEEVFVDIPKEYYLDSIGKDSEESFQNIQEKTTEDTCIVPNYAVLNFCRVLAFIDQNLITSKVEGGEWALKNLPEKYHPVISAALQEYRNTGSSEKIDGQLLKEFAVYAHNKISQSLSPLAELRQATIIASAGASTRLAGSKLPDEEVERISKSSEQK